MSKSANTQVGERAGWWSAPTLLVGVFIGTTPLENTLSLTYNVEDTHTPLSGTATFL